MLHKSQVNQIVELDKEWSSAFMVWVNEIFGYWQMLTAQ